MKRASKLVPRLIAGQTSSHVLRWALRAGWSIFGKKRIRDYVHLKIQQDLIRRDQHADFRFANDNERKVFAELSDPAFDYRTLDGLQRSTGLSREAIQQMLDSFPSEIYVARSQAPGKEDGYTLTSRKPNWMQRNVGTLVRPSKFG